MAEDQPTEPLVEELSHALQHLYDPLELGRSPLLARFGLERRPNPALALQETLIAAIHALKPATTVPSQATAQRLYYILTYRYVEQSPQKEVANDLALSIRQLRRLEDEAIALLADSLARRYGFVLVGEQGSAGAQDARGASSVSAARKTELDWLRKSLPIEAANAVELVQSVLQTAQPVLHAAGVTVELCAPASLPPIACQATTLRQALLNLVTAAGRTVPSGRVKIELRVAAQRVEISIRPVLLKSASENNREYRDSVELARQLVELSDGTVKAQADADMPPAITLNLRLAGQRTVLVIDDNADALQLAARCLIGSRYTFVGSRDPEQGLLMAARVAPCAIVLDVVLPGIDGWELLGRLRTHPATANIPVIVATILPQEQLALALGAAAFLHKPLSREALLTTLDELIKT